MVYKYWVHWQLYWYIWCKGKRVMPTLIRCHVSKEEVARLNKVVSKRSYLFSLFLSSHSSSPRCHSLSLSPFRSSLGTMFVLLFCMFYPFRISIWAVMSVLFQSAVLRKGSLHVRPPTKVRMHKTTDKHISTQETFVVW